MEKTLQILATDGSVTGTVDVLDAWLEAQRGEQAVKDVVVAFLAGRRAGTAATKTRGLVAGSGAKPWRQKGTGRARVGSIRNPVWRGGGIIFGPMPRSYAKKVNARVRRLALRRAFNDRLAEGGVIVLADLVVDGKTQQLANVLKAVGAGDDVLVVTDSPSPKLLLAARNLPAVEVMKPGSVNPYWLLLFKKIVFTRAGFDLFVKRLVEVAA